MIKFISILGYSWYGCMIFRHYYFKWVHKLSDEEMIKLYENT